MARSGVGSGLRAFKAASRSATDRLKRREGTAYAHAQQTCEGGPRKDFPSCERLKACEENHSKCHQCDPV